MSIPTIFLALDSSRFLVLSGPNGVASKAPMMSKRGRRKLVKPFKNTYVKNPQIHIGASAAVVIPTDFFKPFPEIT